MARPKAKPVKETSVKKAAPLAHSVGRRKTSVARVWLRKGTGNILVNEKKYTDYFDTDIARLNAVKAFQAVPVGQNYDVEISVFGGGQQSQAGAVKLGIARALLSIDEGMRPVLRGQELLTVDSRQKERKKYGQKAARRKFQFVKR